MFRASTLRFCVSTAAAIKGVPAVGVSDPVTIEVSRRTTRLRHLHIKSSSEPERLRMQSFAWMELQRLSEQGIETAAGEEASSLLTTWAYFAKFWDGGVEGILNTPMESQKNYEAFMATLDGVVSPDERALQQPQSITATMTPPPPPTDTASVHPAPGKSRFTKKS